MSRRERRARKMAPRWFVFTEGKSEVLYLSRFRARGMPVSVIPIQAGNTDIRGIADYCMRELELRGVGDVEGDRATIVFDRDRNTMDMIAEAERRCGDVGMLMSNPSYEHWLLLHFEDSTKPMDQREMEERLGRLLGRRYSKGEDLTRSITDGMIRDAIGRAERRLPKGSCTLEGCFGREPSTMLYVLVSELRGMSEAVRWIPKSRKR